MTKARTLVVEAHHKSERADAETIARSARGYMRAGFPVLPLHGVTDHGDCTCGNGADCTSPGKHPYAKAAPHGLESASTDPAEVDAWLAAGWRGNLGMRLDGHLVFDLDDWSSGDADFAELKRQFGDLPATRWQVSGSGSHFLYRLPDDVTLGNSTKALGNPLHVHIRSGQAGYIVVEPSLHQEQRNYRWYDRAQPVADLPAEWVALLAAKPSAPARPPGAKRPPKFESDGQGTPYGRKALVEEAAVVADAPEGQRNETLVRSAFVLGQLVAGGELAAETVVDALADAAEESGLPHGEASRTIENGMRAGMEEPRSAPLDDPTPEPIGIATDDERAKAKDGLAELLTDVEDFIGRFVLTTDAQRTACALWVFHTHTFRASVVTPYLEIYSAEMQSGKTRLLEVLNSLAANPWMTGGSTAAALIRKVHEESPTLFYDEADATFKAGGERAEYLRGILNNGFSKTPGCYTAAVKSGKDDWVAKDFNVYCPKVIAGIGRLPETVQSRSIPIEMRRKPKGQDAEKWRTRIHPIEGEVLRARLIEWSGPATLVIAGDPPPATPQELSDRAADFWEPLLSVADLAGHGWPEKARKAALDLCGPGVHVEEGIGILTLRTIREMFDAFGPECDRVTTADLIRHLASIDDGPWSHWYDADRGKPDRKGAMKLGRTLKPYRIASKTLRFSDESRVKGFLRDDFEDAWSRYL
jgi:hypothetical protein